MKNPYFTWHLQFLLKKFNEIFSASENKVKDNGTVPRVIIVAIVLGIILIVIVKLMIITCCVKQRRETRRKNERKTGKNIFALQQYY